MLLDSSIISRSEKNLINISNNIIEEKKDNDNDNENNYYKSQSDKILMPVDLNIGKKCRKIRDYFIIKEIDEGAFGSVYLVQKEKTDELYALKVLNKDFLIKTEKTEEPMIERNILLMCDHPSIIKLIKTFQTKHKLYFVLEYINNTNLNNLLEKISIIPNKMAKQIIAELVNVIHYLHIKMNISHNDLKPSNIMLDDNYHIKLIDFSTSKIHGKVFDKTTGKFIDSENYVSNELLGTVNFMSPEMLNHNIVDYRTNDIWALGVIIYTIYIGERPFKGKNDFFTSENIKKCIFSFKNKNIPEEVKDLINNIFVLDANKRINIEQIKNHKYFEDIKWNDLLNHNIIIDKKLFDIKEDKNAIYWDNYFSRIENANNIDNLNNKQEFKIHNYQNNISDAIINDFYYLQYNNYNEEIKRKDFIIKDKKIYEGILNKIGFKEKEVKLILYNDYTIDVINLENNKPIKKIIITKNINIKIEKNQTELIIEKDKYKSSKKEIDKWYTLITDINFCRDI
jgi:serine/threonine protein kinase